jgi:hypothetical protein
MIPTQPASPSSLQQQCNPASSSGGGVYGFVLWLFSFALLVGYFIWTLVPASVLINTPQSALSLALSFLPDKYWAVVAPLQLCFTVAFIIAIYGALNLANTPDLHEACVAWDPHSARGRHNNGDRYVDLAGDTPVMNDIPPSDVSKILHYRGI